MKRKVKTSCDQRKLSVVLDLGLERALGVLDALRSVGADLGPFLRVALEVDDGSEDNDEDDEAGGGDSGVERDVRFGFGHVQTTTLSFERHR